MLFNDWYFRSTGHPLRHAFNKLRFFGFNVLTLPGISTVAFSPPFGRREKINVFWHTQPRKTRLDKRDGRNTSHTCALPMIRAIHECCVHVFLFSGWYVFVSATTAFSGQTKQDGLAVTFASPSQFPTKNTPCSDVYKKHGLLVSRSSAPSAWIFVDSIS